MLSRVCSVVAVYLTNEGCRGLCRWSNVIETVSTTRKHADGPPLRNIVVLYDYDAVVWVRRGVINIRLGCAISLGSMSWPLLFTSILQWRKRWKDLC